MSTPPRLPQQRPDVSPVEQHAYPPGAAASQKDVWWYWLAAAIALFTVLLVILLLTLIGGLALGRGWSGRSNGESASLDGRDFPAFPGSTANDSPPPTDTAKPDAAPDPGAEGTSGTSSSEESSEKPNETPPQDESAANTNDVPPAEEPPAPGPPSSPKENGAGGSSEANPNAGSSSEANSNYVPIGGFFGIQATGKSHVYVIDCSGSMEEEGRLDRAKQELLSAIREFSENQEFCVIFFSSHVFPQFGHPPDKLKLVRATKANIAAIETWIDTVQAVGGTEPHKALALAMQLNPDAIYLLSDGEFELAPVLRLIDRTHYENPIHTIGFSSREGEPMLKKIAKRTNGMYVFVQ